MLAVHLESGRVEVVHTVLPERPEGFALIRLIAAGICNTDLELQRGYYGFSGTPGHEFVGEVVECDTPELRGKRVVGDINLPCRRCTFCWRGMERHCPNRTVLGIVKHPGAFREFLTLPERNLHVVPDSVATEEAVFAEPLAAACEILDQVWFNEGFTLAVLGDGKLGLLIAQMLQARKCRVHLFGRHRNKLAIAERKGVKVHLVGANPPVAEYEFVVDATGSAAGLRTAVSMTVPKGTVMMKSTVHGDVPMDVAHLIVNEITLMGSRCGRMEPSLKLLEERSVDVASMISERLPLEKAEEAFVLAAKPGVMKVLLTAS